HGPGQLLEKEGVAFGLAEDRVDDRVVHRFVTSGRADDAAAILRGQAPQRQPGSRTISRAVADGTPDGTSSTAASRRREPRRRGAGRTPPRLRRSSGGPRRG